MVPKYLVPGPGGVRARTIVSQGMRALYKEVAEGKGSGLVGLHIKGMLLSIPFTTSSS